MIDLNSSTVNPNEQSNPNQNLNIYPNEWSRVYLTLKNALRTRSRRTYKIVGSEPFTSGRDPKFFSTIFTELIEDNGWDSAISKQQLLISWPQIIGPENAFRAIPESIIDEVLLIRCKSTSWATQLRTMRNTILTRIITDYPAAGITTVDFRGPDAPSWKRGPRSVSGRGPRDTYG